VIPFGYKAFTPSGKARHTNHLPKTHSGDGAYCNNKAPHTTAEAVQPTGAGITPSADGFLWNADGNRRPAEGNWWESNSPCLPYASVVVKPRHKCQAKTPTMQK
jgi:hypothetical protein